MEAVTIKPTRRWLCGTGFLLAVCLYSQEIVLAQAGTSSKAVQARVRGEFKAFYDDFTAGLTHHDVERVVSHFAPDYMDADNSKHRTAAKTGSVKELKRRQLAELFAMPTDSQRFTVHIMQIQILDTAGNQAVAVIHNHTDATLRNPQTGEKAKVCSQIG